MRCSNRTSTSSDESPPAVDEGLRTVASRLRFANRVRTNRNPAAEGRPPNQIGVRPRPSPSVIGLEFVWELRG